MNASLSFPKRQRTDAISEPLWLHIMRVPDVLWEVGRALINVDKLDELGVEMWVSERPIRHQRVIKMLGIARIPFQSMKLGQFGLQDD